MYINNQYIFCFGWFGELVGRVIDWFGSVWLSGLSVGYSQLVDGLVLLGAIFMDHGHYHKSTEENLPSKEHDVPHERHIRCSASALPRGTLSLHAPGCRGLRFFAPASLGRFYRGIFLLS